MKRPWFLIFRVRLPELAEEPLIRSKKGDASSPPPPRLLFAFPCEYTDHSCVVIYPWGGVGGKSPSVGAAEQGDIQQQL